MTSPHISEEQLIELYYDEAPNAHLEGCGECQAQFAELRSVLEAFHDFPVPEPPPFRWQPPQRFVTFQWRRWLLAPAFAAALFAAFYLGRATDHRSPAAPLADASRERILLVTLSDHLERSQMVLLDVANGAALPGSADRARNLIGQTRLYRQTTLYAGDRNYAQLLDELDRVLTAIANQQSQSSALDTERIEQLLFKMRVTGANLQKGTEQL